MRDSKLGIVEIQVRHGSTLSSEWYKVKGERLCTNKSNRSQVLYVQNNLVAINTQNIVLNKILISTLELDSKGYIVNIIKNDSVTKVLYYHAITSIENTEDQDVQNWYTDQILSTINY